MTADQDKLLAVFEVRVRDLMALCDKQKHEIDELTTQMSQMEEELRLAREEIEALKTKSDNLLTARVISVNEEEMKEARTRLSMLVREVTKCIALLKKEG